MGDVAITELEKIDATRVDGVESPANGIPILLLKSTAPVTKGARDCPKCSKSYDADHQGGKCENCGTDLPDAPAAKAAGSVDCPTCKGDGKIMGGKRDCPDCDASSKVTPAKAKTLAAKSLPGWHAEATELVKKAMVRGKVDESADIDGGQHAIALVGKLIGYEAQELAAGNLGEVADIGLLADAAGLLRQWVSGESAVQDGNVMPATALMQSAAEGVELTDEQYAEWKAELEKVLKANPSWRLLPPGVAKSRDYSAAELGVANPLDNNSDTAKSQIAKEGTTVDNDTQTGDLSEVVKAAVAKAVAPIEKLRKELEETLAKVKATPVPGGPVLSRNVQVKTPGGAVNEDLAAKAALFRAKADVATSPADRDGYLALARETEKAAKTTS